MPLVEKGMSSESNTSLQTKLANQTGQTFCSPHVASPAYATEAKAAFVVSRAKIKNQKKNTRRILIAKCGTGMIRGKCDTMPDAIPSTSLRAQPTSGRVRHPHPSHHRVRPGHVHGRLGHELLLVLLDVLTPVRSHRH